MGQVELDFGYPIEIWEGGFDRFQTLLQEQPGRKLILTDTNLARIYKDQLDVLVDQGQASLFVVPAGEASKSLVTYEQVLAQLNQEGFQRSDTLVAFGGGVIGDLGGFVAATYLRGIHFLQVPTTLLAMVDSSVGAKNGINFQGYKNQIGTFYPADHVHIDSHYLKTLAPTQLANGLAEVIKYGLLKDSSLIDDLHGRNLDYTSLIHRSLAVKYAFVQGDLHDRGQRQFLNLGHTFGHAIESVSHNQFNHGQAVAIGMLWMARAAKKLAYTDQDLVPLLTKLYQLHGLSNNCDLSSAAILQAVTHDKKGQGSHLYLIIPIAKGHCIRQKFAFDELNKWLEAGREER